MTSAAARPTHELVAGADERIRKLLEATATDDHFDEGAVIFDEGQPARIFYLITSGRVALEITNPGHAPMTLQTLGPGDLLGLSWLFPPHRWAWRARAVTDTDTLAFDAGAVRDLVADDDAVARHITDVVAKEAIRRLHTTRIHLLDLYRAKDR